WPFSLRIVAGPSTTRTSATWLSGTCTGPPSPAAGSRFAGPPALLVGDMPGAPARAPTPLPLTTRPLTHPPPPPLARAEAAAHREAVAVLDRLRDDPAAQGHLDGLLHVGDARAVARRPGAVDLHLQVVLAPDLPGQHALRPLDRLQRRGDLLAHPVDGLQI